MTVAVIPARGGSKRLPGKNLRLVGGKSLVQRAIESAWHAKAIDRIVVSTEDREIEYAANGVYFALTGPNPVSAPPKPFDVLKRPMELTQDTTPMIEVMRHALVETGYPDVLVCLQPTTPFRTAALVDDVLAELRRGDSVVTVYAGHPTGEVYVTQRHLLLAGRMLGPRCVDYGRPSGIINIDGEYDLVRAERACQFACLDEAKPALSWPVR